MWSMAAGQGLGTLPPAAPLPRFWVLEPCFQFCPLGTPTRFAFAFLAPLGILPLVFFLFAACFARCVRCVSLPLLAFSH